MMDDANEPAKKKRRSKSKKNSDPTKKYLFDRPKLGLVEIINNLDKEQFATHNDVREVTHAFRWCGMNVKQPSLNVNKKQFQAKLEKILDPKREDFKDYNMIVLVLICHGKKGDELISSDGEVCGSIEQISVKLDEIESFRGRPKILILESCRGEKDNFTEKAPNKCEQNSVNVGRGSDMIIAYSTVPDYVSLTFSEGSPYLILLANKIVQLAYEQNFEDIMRIVRNEINEVDNKATQVPQTFSTTRKQIFLKNGDHVYQKSGTNKNNLGYRMFVFPRDENDSVTNGTGRGFVCFENRHCFTGEFKNGKISFRGTGVYEWPNGDVEEIKFDEVQKSKSWDDYTGTGTMRNIRNDWKYKGPLGNNSDAISFNAEELGKKESM